MRKLIIPTFLSLCVSIAVVFIGQSLLWGEESPVKEEIPVKKVVGKDMQILKFDSTYALTAYMRGLTVALGVSCKHCHNLKKGFEINEETLFKDKARLMLKMMDEINQTYFKDKPESHLTCYACHRGRKSPVPSHAEWLKIQEAEKETDLK